MKIAGLSSEEAEKRLKEFGRNEFFEYQKPDIFTSISESIQPQIYVFLFASILLFFYNVVYAGFCLAIILAVMVFSVREDLKTRGKIIGIEAFSQKCIALRDGKKKEIDYTEVVPGDVLFLKPGDRIPADGFVLKGFGKVSEEVFGRGIKEKREISETERKEIIAFKKENPSILLAGSFLIEGEIVMKVEKTGPQTSFAKIPASAEKREDIKRIEKFVEEINPLIFLVSAVIFFALAVRGENLILSFSVAAAAAVAGIPYYIYTTAQATFFTSIERISKNFLIRREDFLNKLQDIDVVCIEKIKNFTTGEKTIKKIYMNKIIDVTGDGYNPFGEFLQDGKRLTAEEMKEIDFLSEICAISSFSKIEKKNDKFEVRGNEIENALLVLSLKPKIEKMKFFEEIEKLQRERKEKEKIFYTKCKGKGITIFGDAFEVLKKCKAIHGKDEKDEKEIEREKKEIEKKIIELSAAGYETIGIGYKKPGRKGTFLAILAIQDPVRENAKEIVESFQKKGIEVIILTSEKENLAVDFARKIGILKKGKRAIIAEEFVNVSEKEREKLIQSCVVFARANEREKEIIIKELKKKKKVLLVESVAKDKRVLIANCNVVSNSSNDLLKFHSDAVGDVSFLPEAMEEAEYYEKCLKKIVYSIFTLDFLIIFYVMFASVIYGKAINPVVILVLNSIADTFSGLSIPKKKEIKLEEIKKEKLLSIKEITFSFFVCVFVAVASLLIEDPTFGTSALIFSFIFISLSYATEESIFKEFDIRDFELAIAMAAFFIFILFFPIASFFGLGQITFKELGIAAGIGIFVLVIFEVRKILRK
jgi:Ca2+-transporting ATPase